MSNMGVVDKALDDYVVEMNKRNGIDPEGFQTKTLAAIAGRGRSQMSELLQQYRWRQQKMNTRYVIAASGYGRASRWHILAKPGSDPKVVRQARCNALLWSSHDMLRRFWKDAVCEIYPGLKGTAVDAIIESATQSTMAHLTVDVQQVERQLSGLNP